ncbi:MAG: class I SAM-dependent methyltransferase [Puniceicoccaceae bacterium]|nr:MAG: class I SAM-dependent methyltransferase [Puniceicoccaceae bacterium]
MTSPTTRFSDRVDHYVRWRPTYPPEVIGLLRDRCRLGPDSVVADCGAGTGIFTKLLLATGCHVHAVEPNQEMRGIAELQLGDQSGFTSHAATAEATGLPAASADLITVAQAFHWFDRDACQKEFARILRPEGWVALIWNERLTEGCAFLEDYERFLHTHGTDYASVSQRRIDDRLLADWFAPGSFSSTGFSNRQSFDLEGLTGRALSSSYIPNADHPRHSAMLAALRTLFDRHQENGRVDFLYRTTVHLGRPRA